MGYYLDEYEEIEAMRVGTMLVLFIRPDLLSGSGSSEECLLRIAVVFMAALIDVISRVFTFGLVLFALTSFYEKMAANAQNVPLEYVQVRDFEKQGTESRHRSRRDRPGDSGNAADPPEKTCGATAIRLNLDLNRIYGEWYPTEASASSYKLLATSLYGLKNGTEMSSTICPTMKLTCGTEAKTMNIVLTHKDKSMTAQAALLGDARHPGTSKWAISWPNGEDTLTSIVACGSTAVTEGADQEFEWLLTVDCDLKGSVAPDWTIFSRHQGLPTATIKAIKAIIDGIAGLEATNSKKLGKECA